MFMAAKLPFFCFGVLAATLMFCEASFAQPAGDAPSASVSRDDSRQPSGKVVLFDEIRLAQAKKTSVEFVVPATPQGLDAVLIVRARIDTPRVAGHTPALSVVASITGTTT